MTIFDALFGISLIVFFALVFGYSIQKSDASISVLLDKEDWARIESAQSKLPNHEGWRE